MLQSACPSWQCPGSRMACQLDAAHAQVYRGLKGGITDVAIKTLLHRDEATHNQFLVEINLLRSLSFDRYIVQFYGACLTSQYPMLVLVGRLPLLPGWPHMWRLQPEACALCVHPAFTVPSARQAGKGLPQHAGAPLHSPLPSPQTLRCWLQGMASAPFSAVIEP